MHLLNTGASKSALKLVQQSAAEQFCVALQSSEMAVTADVMHFLASHECCSSMSHLIMFFMVFQRNRLA